MSKLLLFFCLIVLVFSQEISEHQYTEQSLIEETTRLALDTNLAYAPPRGSKLVITADRLNIRATASTSARILTTLSNGAIVSFTGETANANSILWYGVESSDFGKGFASSQYLRVQDNGAHPGTGVAAWALQQVGKGYTQRQCPAQCCRLGPNCFDCSGLLYVGYKRAGYTIPISTHGYNANSMQRVARANLRVGDMLWRVGHIGIYVGNGVMVEAANPTKGVIRSQLANFRYEFIYRPKGTLNVTAVNH